jgi:hypothetical protein
MKAMKLIGVVANLANLDEESTIYATRPWARDSVALVAREPDAGGLPQDAQIAGLHYFIEVLIAKEFLSDWARNEKRTIPLQEQCDRLIHYAIYDA